MSLDDCVREIALYLTGESKNDGEVVWDFCQTFGVMPEAILHQLLARCVYPISKVEH